MTGKTLVIGDIHGCYEELQDLLAKVPLTDDDEIIHIGDLMDRGPYPAEVAEFFMNTPNARSIRGNRDDKHISAYDGRNGVGYIRSRAYTRQQINDPDRYKAIVDYMRTLPLYLDLPAALLVHGYYDPALPLDQQDPNVLLGHTGEDRLYYSDLPWFKRYQGDKPIMVGHREYPVLHYQSKVYFIDTRCVYGGTLTGVLLPDFTVYSVPARADYYTDLLHRYPGQA